MGLILNVVDEKGNGIPHNRVKVVGCCPVNNGCDEITIQIFDKKDIFTDEDIDLIMELLLNSLDDCGTYDKLKKIIGLIDKLNEENTINK